MGIKAERSGCTEELPTSYPTFLRMKTDLKLKLIHLKFSISGSKIKDVHSVTMKWVSHENISACILQPDVCSQSMADIDCSVRTVGTESVALVVLKEGRR